MRVLIIGGTGLISSAITRVMQEQGGFAITHFNRGQRTSAPPQDVRTLHGDRRDFAAFEALISGEIAARGPFDAVIDMVGYQPDEADSVLRAFGNGQARQYVFCSTVDAYEKPYRTLPVPNDHPLGGINPYGRNKAEFERRLMAAHQRGDLNVTILRPGHTYNDGGTLIHAYGGNQFLDRLKRGKPIIVHGDGSSLWTLAHADDAVPAFVNALGNEDVFGKSYNLAGEEWLTWDQLFQTTCRVMGWPEPELVHIPSDQLALFSPRRASSIGDNFRFNNIFDNSRAIADLGYRYTIRFEEAVRRIVPTLEARPNGIPACDDFPWYNALLNGWQHQTSNLAAILQRDYGDTL